MNNSKLSFIALAMSAAICSCSDDKQDVSSEYINSVRVTVEDFVPEILDTRTAYTVDNTGFHFTWTDGDALGIYPVGGDQVKFPISSGDGSASASFDGGAWKLRSTYQYAAYYPFSTANYTVAQTALPASFTGQAQNGNNTTAHLSAYDYLACAATIPDGSGGVDLTMKHLGAFLRLQLTMPKADTYSSVVLESDGVEFVTAGTFDLTAATPAITSTATSSTFTINLNNISTTAANEVLTIYAILAPSYLSTSNITVTIHGTGLTTYVQTVTGKNFEARKAYNIAVTSFPSGTNASGEDVNWEEETATHEYVDLGLPSGTLWATCNVGASRPEEYGDYFAWGETTGYNSGKTNFDWTTYKWCNGSYNTMTKYDNINGAYADFKTKLELLDDVAYVNWGDNWRTPSKDQFDELENECNCQWTTINGVYGRKITSKKNGNSIFFPASGKFSGSTHFMSINNVAFGNYMSRSAHELYNYLAFTWLTSAEYCQGEYLSRYEGTSVRPVISKIVNNGYEYVDLGLPSRTLWATCNVGANKPEEAGNYYAWGETETKSVYDWDTYLWCSGTNTTLTKYCRNDYYGLVDLKLELELQDDAARFNMGGAWRVPSDVDFNELALNCTKQWKSINNIYGWELTSKIEGYTNCAIFIPAVGVKRDKLYASCGWYWCFSLAGELGDNDGGAEAIQFDSEFIYTWMRQTRSTGLPIRPVIHQ